MICALLVGPLCTIPRHASSRPSSMVRTEDNGRKKKSASSDGVKAKKEVEKPVKDKTADKKKSEPSSSKAGGQKGKEVSKEKSKNKEVETKPKPAPRQPAARSISQPKVTDDYLGDFDLPSSSDEEELESNGHQALYTGDKEEPEELKPKVEFRVLLFSLHRG